MAEPSSTTFEDLSGISTAAFSNPYDALISACNNDPEEIQTRYALHRKTRNAQQKAKLLDKSFTGVNIDPILLRLTDPTIEPGYVDPRNCLVFWARPTQDVRDLIVKVQKELSTVAPNLWLMPPSNLHLTALEITHSKTGPEITNLVQTMTSHLPTICNHTLTHPTRLIKPMISYDASALALSFVPAAFPSAENVDVEEDGGGDKNYTYHHLRRSLFTLCNDTAGIRVDSRYVVPSSHLTIARFIDPSDFTSSPSPFLSSSTSSTSRSSTSFNPHKMSTFIQKIEEINAWLEAEYWPQKTSNENGNGNGHVNDEGAIKAGGEWLVGKGKGLDCRMGRLWYGDGETVYLGQGF